MAREPEDGGTTTEVAPVYAPFDVFVSYRRAEGGGYAHALCDRLATGLGKRHVWRDIDNIPAGESFPKEIKKAVSRCDLVLVLIGREWCKIADDDGNRRIDDPEDWVRLEIKAALDLDKKVIPVLLQGAHMPAPKELPADLAELATREARELPDVFWDVGVERLLAEIEREWDRKREEVATAQAADERERQGRELHQRRIEAEAEAKRDADERKRKAEEELKAEEERRKAEEERKADEERKDQERQREEAERQRHFAVAHVLSGEQGCVSEDTSPAAKESGEPDHAGNTGGHSVWYRWTAPVDGLATVDTFGSDFDTLLAVYQGSSLTSLEQRAANDDTNGRQSRVRFPVAAGEEYLIAVDGYGGAAGPLMLNWALGDSHDGFGTAEEIVGEHGTVQSENTGATKEPGEPDHAGSAGGHSVWYRWTAPADGLATIDTFGSDFDTLLAVYQGSSLTALDRIADNDDTVGRQSRVDFPVVAGDEYRIAVDGYGGETGSIVLNWRLGQPSLRALMEASDLSFRTDGSGVVVPFGRPGSDQVLVEGRESDAGLVTLSVDLPSPGFVGKATVLHHLLHASYTADYVKAISKPSGELAMVVEQRSMALTPSSIEGLIRGLVQFGGMRPADLANMSGWGKRIASCSSAQASHIRTRTDATMDAIPDMLRSAGIEFERRPTGAFVANLDFAGPMLRVLIVPTEKSISFRLGLKMKAKRNKTFLGQLLELNRITSIAGVGIDGDGDVGLLFEVPALYDDLMAEMQAQLGLLLLGVLAADAS